MEAQDFLLNRTIKKVEFSKLRKIFILTLDNGMYMEISADKHQRILLAVGIPFQTKEMEQIIKGRLNSEEK